MHFPKKDIKFLFNHYLPQTNLTQSTVVSLSTNNYKLRILFLFVVLFKILFFYRRILNQNILIIANKF